ncbi:cyclomaltodextrin glucanotransferase [Vibrio vulnificus]|uniref:alpha-amylase family glycosyl hydrolase n=1 Tax=Vibrio vulnificus TaxID=672 RepID=UPI00034CEA86|nr:alpha-amylase family glycosyl hydrolase [Vibrio vulnificus]EWS67676.1 cyclomaltodextrin glucanotransferase [Vibrio vulnificus BAA87]ALM72497.1 Cyclomaltodextrin glucanotransferase; Maltogenic alpha-amylase [Vibrio vulnificus]ANH64859.1 Cyclomaltodextrin glucanotransferase/ Maltogenic alpha-amylase [Vibrio vulnificus]EIV8465573.1 cyclomaltodextrin glucanotransferase [Vibrio vulnificus]KFK57857.1 cyclomaltodextrin glucanotransferase [Vibrio vulnificus]
MKKRTLLCSALLAAIAANGLFSSSAVLANTSTQAESGSFLDFRQETIYFVFLDRFSDGDASNNAGRNPATYDPNNLKKYVGGDLRGLINQLPYLKSLGVTAIWITPPVDNTDNLDVNGGAAYHGYWGKDFFRVDEHFGTLDDFKELIAKMHSAEYNMKLVLDYAPNHSNGNDENEYGALYRDGQYITDYNADVAAGTNWYHHNGGVTDWNNWYQVRNHNLFNLSDFDQSDESVYQYLLDGSKFWIDAGVDAIRIDAIKHMDKSFIQQWTTDIYNYSKTLGREGFYFFGEWFGASANTTTGIDGYAIDYANTSGSALLDFGFRDTMERVLANRPGNSMKTLNNYLETRKSVFTSDDWQVVFMDNHDMARISTALRSDASTFGPGNNESGGNQTEAFAKQRVNLGLVATMTVRGIPAIYYGTEHYTANFTQNAFGQVGSDPYNREKMPSFNQDTEAFKIIQALTALRKQSLAIQRGSYTQRWVNDDVLVYERQEGDDVVTVALNRGPATSITVSNLSLKDGSHISLIGDESINVSGGQATFHLAQNQAVVLHATGSGSVDPTLKSVTFTCYNGYTNLGQSVYAVGSVAQLGNWAASGAVKLDPAQYPTWSATISVPAAQNIEWKCLKRDETNPALNVVWQSGANNQLSSSSSATQGAF